MMIAETASERELLSVSLHTSLALQEKKKPDIKKNQPNNQILQMKVHLQFVEAGTGPVQLWQQGDCAMYRSAFCSLFQCTSRSWNKPQRCEHTTRGAPSQTKGCSREPHSVRAWVLSAEAPGCHILCELAGLGTHTEPPHTAPGSPSPMWDWSSAAFECGDSSQPSSPAFAAETTHCHAKKAPETSQPPQANQQNWSSVAT